MNSPWLDARFPQGYGWHHQNQTLVEEIQMKRKIALCIPLVLAMGTFALAQNGYHVTTPSTWKMDTAASDMGGAPDAPKSDEYTVTKDTDKWLTYKETMVGADGKTMHMSWNGPVDGKPLPVTGQAGAKCGFSADGKSHCTFADGSVMDQQLHPLAMDAKTATFDATYKDKAGKEYHEKWVYNRQ
jgi:hypothetical protein